jgi:hypothetical protein
MCDIASGIYLEAREVAEHLALLVSRLEHCLAYAPYKELTLSATGDLLQRRGDTLAAEILNHVTERLQANPADPLAALLVGVPLPVGEGELPDQALVLR